MSKSETVLVKIKYTVSHDGVIYNPGDSFECPNEHFEALKECFDLKDGTPVVPVDKTNAPDVNDREAQIKFWDRKKVDEIKSELDSRGLPFPDDGKKAELIEILVGPEDGAE